MLFPSLSRPFQAANNGPDENAAGLVSQSKRSGIPSDKDKNQQP
jgi:hypothetical protein